MLYHMLLTVNYLKLPVVVSFLQLPVQTVSLQFDGFFGYKPDNLGVIVG